MTRLLVLVVAALLAGCQSSPYREIAIELDGSAPLAPYVEGSEQRSELRFAIAAMESPRDTYTGYSRLLERVGRELGVEVELVQRRTYQEINDLLLGGRLDVALVCTGGYVDLLRRAPDDIELLAVPVIDGETTYQSLVIVPESSAITSLDELEGKRFAFTDELSFSGHVYLDHLLRARGKEPERFFGSTIYTHGHDRSIKAVTRGIIDGAVVSSVVFSHQIEQKPSRASKVRVIHRSPRFGMMPVIASKRLPPAQRTRLQQVLLGLQLDVQAVSAMRFLRIDRFEVPAPGLYDDAVGVVGQTP